MKKMMLWNKLGSPAEIENSEMGPDGTYDGARPFVKGLFGGAYNAGYDDNLLVTFPKEAISIEAGAIEIWAKLTNPPDTLGHAKDALILLMIQDEESMFTLHLNSNDGAGNGGVCGRAGRGYSTGTGAYGSWTLKDALNSNQLSDWHHYALVWDKEGISGVKDGTHKVAVFVDGLLNSNRWSEIANSDFVPLTKGEIGLMPETNLSQGRVLYDNLKIWNYAKTDFSDRSEEPTVLEDDHHINIYMPEGSISVVTEEGIRLEIG